MIQIQTKKPVALGGFRLYPQDKKVEKLHTPFELALTTYHHERMKKDMFLIYSFLVAPLLPDLSNPIQHHLLDYNSDQDFRNTHLVVETSFGVEQYSSYGIGIKLSCGIEANLSIRLSDNSAERFTQRTQKEIGDAVRDIECSLLKENKIKFSLFTRDGDGLYQHNVLVCRIAELLKK